MDFNQLPDNTQDTVTVQSDGGSRSVVFKGEDMENQSVVIGPLSDTWKIESNILQCKVRNGVPIRLGRGKR